LKRRDGYTQLGAAISTNAIVGLRSFAFSTGSNATVNYTAADTPDASDPAWDDNGIGTATGTVSGGILTIADTAPDDDLNYSLDDGDLDNSVGSAIEARMKPTILVANEQQLGLKIEDGTRKVELRVLTDKIRVFGLTGSNVTNFTMNTTSTFHTYRMTLQGLTAKVYVDEALVVTYTNTVTSANQTMTFGDLGAGASAHASEWDFVKYWDNGPWAPGTQEILLAANGGDIHRWDGSAYNALGETLQASDVFMVDFIGQMFISNGNDALRTYDGSTVVTTGNAANAPVFRYIERFFDRIYGASEDSNPQRVWFSSVPLEIVAHVRGSVDDTVTSLDVTSSKYIKVGDAIDIYTHATDSKVEDIAVTGVTDEDTITFTSSAIDVSDNDDIYIDGTKGTLGVKWDTSGVPAEDFADFPGEIITGLKRFGDFLMVPCKLSMWAFDKFQNQVPVSRTQGSTSGRSLEVVNQALYYLNQTGIWEWTGTGEPILISQDIQDFIDAISTEFLASTIAWEDLDSYFVYVDDLTVDGRTYENVVIEYNTRFKNWQIHSLPDVIHTSARFAPAPGDTTNRYIGTADGEIHRWRNGTSDDGTVIPLDFETVDYFIGEDQKLKSINRIWVIARDAFNATLEISVDGERFQSVGGIEKRINKFQKTFTGHYFQFRIRHNEINSPQIDSIIIDYTDKGVK